MVSITQTYLVIRLCPLSLSFIFYRFFCKGKWRLRHLVAEVFCKMIFKVSFIRKLIFFVSKSTLFLRNYKYSGQIFLKSDQDFSKNENAKMQKCCQQIQYDICLLLKQLTVYWQGWQSNHFLDKTLSCPDWRLSLLVCRYFDFPVGSEKFSRGGVRFSRRRRCDDTHNAPCRFFNRIISFTHQRQTGKRSKDSQILKFSQKKERKGQKERKENIKKRSL